MDEGKQQEEAPLGDEARKREEWRGQQEIVQEEKASGHSGPASEGDAAGLGTGRQGTSAPSTIPPPD